MVQMLLEHGRLDTTLDPTAIYQYLCFGFVPHPRTAYREIASLPPAHWLQIDADGRQSGHRVLTVQWQDGVRRVVWPPELATADLRHPAR